MKILFTGGGTGGHITPLIAVERELRRLYPENEQIEFQFYGPRDQFTDLLLKEEGIGVHSVVSGKIRRYWTPKSIVQNIFDILIRFPIGICQAFWKIFFLSPDVIISKGGYGALPVTIAGWLLRTPVFLHEADIVPGLANRIAGHFAKEIFTSFLYTTDFPKAKMVFVGNPIRRELTTGSEDEAKELFDLQGDKPVVLIIGGSQGAQHVNEIVLEIVGEMTKSFEVIHITGPRNLEQVKGEANVVIPEDRQSYYHALGFLKETDLRHAYAAADIIVSRAGAGAIFEIAALGKPSILIPLPTSAQNHQIKNAYAYAETEATIVLEENNLTPHFFLEKLRGIMFTPATYKKMSEAAYAFSKPDAARILAQQVVKYLRR